MTPRDSYAPVTTSSLTCRFVTQCVFRQLRYMYGSTGQYPRDTASLRWFPRHGTIYPPRSIQKWGRVFSRVDILLHSLLQTRVRTNPRYQPMVTVMRTLGSLNESCARASQTVRGQFHLARRATQNGNKLNTLVFPGSVSLLRHSDLGCILLVRLIVD